MSFPVIEKRIDRRLAGAAFLVLQVRPTATNRSCELAFAIRSLGTSAAGVRKTRFSTDAAEACGKRNCARASTGTAACNRAQSAHARTPQAFRIQLQTGTLFHTRGNPDIYLCARRKLRSPAQCPRPRESSAEFGPAANPLPNAIAGKLGSDSNTGRNARSARSLHRLAAVRRCYVLRSQSHMSPTKRPRANVPLGSNAFLTRCQRSIVPSACAHTSSSAFQSLGQNNIEAWNSI